MPSNFRSEPNAISVFSGTPYTRQYSPNYQMKNWLAAVNIRLQLIHYAGEIQMQVCFTQLSFQSNHLPQHLPESYN